MKIWATTPESLKSTKAECLDYDITLVERRIFTQTQKTIVHDHCKNAPAGTFYDEVINPNITIPVLITVVFLVVLLLPRLLRHINGKTHKSII